MYSGVELAHAWIVLTFGTFNINLYTRQTRDAEI